MMRNVRIAFVCLLSVVSFVYGQENDSSIFFGENEPIESNLDANLDSLLNLYYVRQSLDNDAEEFFLDFENDSVVPEYDDSVYISRLKQIPSVVDLTYNRIVHNFIKVYTEKRRDRVEIMLGLADYYFPIFDEIFDYYDVPNEMKYMAIIESALNPRALSRARALGLWQFMYGTGRLYGLEINSYVDERMDPIKATHAAVRFSKDLYEIYGDWQLVIAAYNCGPGNVNKAIRRSGGKRNYWDIYYHLPRETRGHVPAFIAATYVMHYYKEHNLQPIKMELPIASDTLMVAEELHLKQVAEVLNIPIEKLRDMNPQYRRDVIPDTKNMYALRLPLQYSARFIAMEDSIFAYKDSVFFNPKQEVVTPQRYVSSHTPSTPKNHTKLYYTVKPGDNLGFIADWYDVGLSQVRYWNNIHRNLIRAGQKLVIYKPKSVASNYKNIDSMSFAEKQQKEGKNAKPASEPPPDIRTGDYFMYTVQYGDTLWDIARKYPGVSDADIMKWNDLSYNDKIQPGQKLRIKKQG
jgi:membrane-bound lytic murein transglycosylase D